MSSASVKAASCLEAVGGAAVYDFGDLSIAFESDHPRWLDFLERRYNNVRSSSTPSFTIEHVSKGTPPATLQSPLAIHLETHVVERTTRGFHIRALSSSCAIDLESRRAQLEGPCAMYPLDNLLRYLLPLIWDDGLILHGAALAGRSLGYLATGPSGAGKSTLSRLCEPHALSDELCGVRSEGTGFRILSLPFWESRPGSTSLDRLLFLKHGPSHALREMSRGEAFRRLSCQTLWPDAFPESVERHFDQLSRLVENVPSWELSFAPRANVWRFLEESFS